MAETLYTELFNLVFGEEEEGPTTYTDTVNIDAVLRKLQTRSIALDAILSAVQTLTQTVDVDAILRALKTEDVSLDAILRIAKTKDIDIDAILKKLQTADISVDSILRIAKTHDLDLDAVLRLAKTFTVNADAILRKTRTKTITLDTVFDVLGYTWGSSTITRDGHKKQIWDGWKLAGGGAARFDASYGKLQINSGETFYSPVKDFGTASSKLLEIDTDYYDTGSGTPGSIYWRGSTTIFAWDDGSPAWEEYTSPTEKTWRYVQVYVTVA